MLGAGFYLSLFENVTSEVLNHTHATTMISTSNLFSDDKKEKYPLDIKMVKKILLQVNFPNLVIGLFLDFCFLYPLVAHLEVSRS